MCGLSRIRINRSSIPYIITYCLKSISDLATKRTNN